MRVWTATKFRSWKPEDQQVEIFASKRQAAGQLQKWAAKIIEDAHLLRDFDGKEKSFARDRVAKSDWIWFAQNWGAVLWIEPKTVKGIKK